MAPTLGSLIHTRWDLPALVTERRLVEAHHASLASSPCRVLEQHAGLPGWHPGGRVAHPPPCRVPQCSACRLASRWPCCPHFPPLQSTATACRATWTASRRPYPASWRSPAPTWSWTAVCRRSLCTGQDLVCPGGQAGLCPGGGSMSTFTLYILGRFSCAGCTLHCAEGHAFLCPG